MYWRLRLGGALLIFGVMLLIAGVREWQLGIASSAAPEDVTLEALIARGPDGNPNVRVSDFALGDDYLAISDYHDFWQSVLIPAMPKTMGEQSAHVLTPKVIVKSTIIKSDDGIQSLGSRVRLQGMVINRIEELGREEKSQLLELYPGLDFSKCIILEESRQPSDFNKVFFMGAGGLAMLLGGGWTLMSNLMRL